MTTFAVMKARVLDEISRPDLTTNDDAAVLSAISHYKYRRFWFNERMFEDADATTADEEYVAYPSGGSLPSGVSALLSIDRLEINVGNGYFELARRSAGYIAAMNEGVLTGGTPVDYAEYQGQVRLSPAPADEYDLRWSGIVEFTALSADVSTNAWVVEAEELIRERAKAYLLCNVIRDPEARAEARSLAGPGGKSCLSIMERAALKTLTAETVRRRASFAATPAR